GSVGLLFLGVLLLSGVEVVADCDLVLVLVVVLALAENVGLDLALGLGLDRLLAARSVGRRGLVGIGCATWRHLLSRKAMDHGPGGPAAGQHTTPGSNGDACVESSAMVARRWSASLSPASQQRLLEILPGALTWTV